MAGDCFEANTNVILDIWMTDRKHAKDLMICHGEVIGAKGSKVEGRKFMHCWIENKQGDVIFDYSNGNRIVGRKEQIEKRIIGGTVRRFTAQQIARLVSTHEHYGDFTDEELKIIGG